MTKDNQNVVYVTLIYVSNNLFLPSIYTDTNINGHFYVHLSAFKIYALYILYAC